MSHWGLPRPNDAGQISIRGHGWHKALLAQDLAVVRRLAVVCVRLLGVSGVLSVGVTRRDVERWMIPVATERLAEEMPGERDLLLKLIKFYLAS
jgi:hypothetical protein